MADNFLYIPFLNPVKFYKVDRSNIPAYYSKHFDDYPFPERLFAWQQSTDYVQPWQTTDIIKLQFESTFDPITVSLVPWIGGPAVIELPALVGMPNKYYPNMHAYEVSMSLASVPSGCYKLRIVAGSGEEAVTYETWRQCISSTPFTVPSLLIKYWHNRFHADVMFESGIQFQHRVFGYIGKLKKGIASEKFRDQKFNPYLLSSKTFRQFQIVFGDEFGLPDDIYDLLGDIWGCNNVEIDGKLFCIYESDEFELEEVDDYPKRGIRILAAEGLNRNSAIFSQDVDTTKKLVYGVMVSNKVFGDLSNQGSSNTVPINNIE